MTTTKCLFDAPTVAVVVHPPKYIAGRAPPPTETRATGRKALAWTDCDSVYRSSAQYLAARAPGERLLFAGLADLPAWQEYWGVTAGTAVAGEPRFAGQKLLGVGNPTGPIPADLGAKLD